jgi:hypothetical protein
MSARDGAELQDTAGRVSNLQRQAHPGLLNNQRVLTNDPSFEALHGGQSIDALEETGLKRQFLSTISSGDGQTASMRVQERPGGPQMIVVDPRRLEVLEIALPGPQLQGFTARHSQFGSTVP